MYLAKLKAALNIAIKEKILTVNPAQDISIDKENTHTENLTIEEIRKLYESPCMSDQTKRAFIFSCFTGLRISDIKKLTWDEIRDNHLLYKSKKTKKYEKMKIHSRALKILEEQRVYQKQNNPLSERVFKLVSDNHTNKHIKKWAIDAGLSKKVTWHVGRHTFATLNLTSGNDIFTTSKLLGHEDVKVTQIYAKLNDSKKDEAIDRLPDIYK
jgi:site-specific recombinase XerC